MWTAEAKAFLLTFEPWKVFRDTHNQGSHINILETILHRLHTSVNVLMSLK